MVPALATKIYMILVVPALADKIDTSVIPALASKMYRILVVPKLATKIDGILIVPALAANAMFQYS